MRTRFCGIPKISWRLFAALLMVVLTGCLRMGVGAQTIRIKLVNGKNGHPMADKCVNVGVDHLKHMLAIPTDKDGVASLRLTDKDAEINTQNSWNGCGDFGVVNPVVKYADTISIVAGYVVCLPHVPDYSWLKFMTFATNKIIQSGIVMPNACGKATASPEPGEVILFVRPLTFWEKWKA